MVSSPQATAAHLGAGPWSELHNAIEQRLDVLLEGHLPSHHPILHAMRTSTLAGGKRIRPMLLVLAARGLGSQSPALLDLGCAVEMVHTASLILDDLPCMDDASLRRGQPSLHRRFGEGIATLASVALLTHAFGLIVGATGLADQQRTRMVAQLAEAVGGNGLVRGQYEDLYESCRPRAPHDVAHTNDLKTGALFVAALTMAGLAAQASDVAMTSLRALGREIGQAFQLFDDLTDSQANLGKDTDQDAGKSTLVALLGRDTARRRLSEHLTAAERQLAQLYTADQPIRAFTADLFARFEAGLTALDIEPQAHPLQPAVPEAGHENIAGHSGGRSVV